MPRLVNYILNLLGLRNNSDPFDLPAGARVVYDEDGIIHYAHNGGLFERDLSNSHEELIYQRDGDVWEPDESGWSEADSDAFYLDRHGDIPPSMLVDDEDERWVY